jgi:hypothetical protein
MRHEGLKTIVCYKPIIFIICLAKTKGTVVIFIRGAILGEKAKPVDTSVGQVNKLCWGNKVHLHVEVQ